MKVNTSCSGNFPRALCTFLVSFVKEIKKPNQKCACFIDLVRTTGKIHKRPINTACPPETLHNFLHAFLSSIVSASASHTTNHFQLKRKRAVISGGLLTHIVSSFPGVIGTTHIQMGKGSASCPQVHYPCGPLERDSMCVCVSYKEAVSSSLLSLLSSTAPQLSSSLLNQSIWV